MPLKITFPATEIDCDLSEIKELLSGEISYESEIDGAANALPKRPNGQ